MGIPQSSMEGVGLNATFWKDKRVFLTGHTGFKGAWLCELLTALGADVAGFALEPPTDPSLFEQQALADRIDHTIGDVRDLAALEHHIGRLQPEIVFHMAAQSLVRESYRDPIGTYSTNVIGTANLLEACRALRQNPAIVVLTSDKCYENREWYWSYREVDRLGGFDPYSSSKACAELVVAAYRASFFNSEWRGSGPGSSGGGVATARAGNVVGGGDWSTDRLVPDLVRSFLASQPAAIRNPGAVRPWQHVLDPLHGYLGLAERLATEGPGYAEAWNFGPSPGDARTVEWLADRLCGLWPAKVEWHVTQDAQPHETSNLHLDSSKAKARLDWTPAMGLEEAIGLTLEWYVAYAAGRNVAELTRQQVQAFLERLSLTKEPRP